MTNNEFTNIAVAHVLSEAVRLHASLLTVLMKQIIVPLLVAIPEEVWKRECDNSRIPCGKLGCKCHLQAESILTIWDEIRDEAKAKQPAAPSNVVLRIEE